MIELEYSLITEATKEPDYFGFYTPDLEGFSGIGHSIGDCIYRAKWGMKEHVNLLKERGLPIPPPNPNPKIIIQTKRNWQLHSLIGRKTQPLGLMRNCIIRS